MNELQFLSNGIIGSKEALKRLETLKEATILVLSDSHRNRDLCLEIMTERAKNCDAVFFLGDGVQDILYCVQVAQSDAKVRENMPSAIFIVEGNVDPHNYTFSTEGMVAGIRKRERVDLNFLNFLFVTICGVKIMLTHGHLTNVNEGLTELADFARIRKCPICFYGHTHAVSDTAVNGVRLINPGCLAKKNNAKSGITFGYFTMRPVSPPTMKIVKCLT